MEPPPRYDHESVLLQNYLLLWGGRSVDDVTTFSRNLIYSYNLVDGRHWQLHNATGNVPPPCYRARCDVLSDVVFTYGGRLEDGSRSAEMYRLNVTAEAMEWKQQNLDPASDKPIGRSSCCLCALGQARLVMFGGYSLDPGDRIRGGAKWVKDPDGFEAGFNNELYEFIPTNKNFGRWSSVETAGPRPDPRCAAAIASIDESRALIFGGMNEQALNDVFVIDLTDKAWVNLSFGNCPSPRGWHSMCRISEEPIFVLTGGKDLKGGYCVRNTYFYNFANWKWTTAFINSLDGSHVDLNPCIAHHSSACWPDSNGGFNFMFFGGMIPDYSSYSFSSQKLNASHLFSPASAVIVQQKNQRISQLEETVSHFQRQLSLKEENRKRADEKEVNDKIEECVAEQTREIEKNLQAHYDQVCAQSVLLLQKAHQDQGCLKRQLWDTAQFLDNLQAVSAELDLQLQNFVKPLLIRRDYFVDRLLGKGSFGEVFAGSWTGQPVALKRIEIKTENDCARFREEVFLLSRLRHPNIVAIYGAIQFLPILVMELLEGSLSELIRAVQQPNQSYLTALEKISLTADMTAAVTYLHTRLPKPYIHSDIRPTNVMVTAAMKAKLGDLGAAHHLGSSSRGPLSKLYQAPERQDPASHSSMPTDIYSLGVTLLEMFTGESPINDYRQRQLRQLGEGNVYFLLCQNMTRRQPQERPISQACLNVALSHLGNLPRSFLLRRIKSDFDGERHKISIIS